MYLLTIVLLLIILSLSFVLNMTIIILLQGNDLQYQYKEKYLGKRKMDNQ